MAVVTDESPLRLEAPILEHLGFSQKGQKLRTHTHTHTEVSFSIFKSYGYRLVTLVINNSTMTSKPTN